MKRLSIVLGKRLIIVGLLALPFHLVLSPTMLAEQNERQSFVTMVWQRFTGRPPSDRTPTMNKGGGNRDFCALDKTEKQVIALVPFDRTYNNDFERYIEYPYLERTVAEHPTLWFYVPYHPKPNLFIHYSLKDETETTVYEKTLPLRRKMLAPGLVAMPLDAIALKTGQNYRWRFYIFCGDNKAEVNGWIERINVDDTTAVDLESQSIRERLSYYTEHLLWLDFLNELAQWQQKTPNNAEAREVWEGILENIGVPRIPDNRSPS